MVKGCPLISREVGLQLLEEYENRKKGLPLSKAEVEDLVEGIAAGKAREWIRERVSLRGDVGLSDVDQLVYLRSLFPEVSFNVLAKACAPALQEGSEDWSELPWNRRLRRSVLRAEEGSVLLAISPFAASWKGMGRVVSVANSEKGLGSRLVFRLLMKWDSGVLGGLVRGPVSCVGFLPSEGEEELVRSLRILLVFAVAQAVRDQGEEEAGASCSEGEDPGSQVFLALDSAIFEGPPVDGLGVLRGELFKPLYGLNVASFDQGCCGASGVRATSLVTSSWFLYETLHEMRVSEGVRSLWASFQGGQEATSDDWTGGLLRIIQNAWVLWKWERAKQEEVRERKAILKKLTEEEAYALHVKNDHVPYRKGCPICISAQGRQRSHWRSGFPGVHSLSVDIAGPLIPGRSWDVEASGRDKGGGYRYFLACAYTIPGEFAPGSGRDESKDDDYAPSECGHMVSDKPSKGTVDTPGALDSSGEQDLFQELDAIPLSLEEVVGVKSVTRRVSRKRPEDPDLEEGPAPKGIKGRRTLFLGVPLRTKQGRETMHQIQGMVNRLESAGFPIQRYHADRAKELRSHALISWLKNKGYTVLGPPEKVRRLIALSWVCRR